MRNTLKVAAFAAVALAAYVTGHSDGQAAGSQDTFRTFCPADADRPTGDVFGQTDASRETCDNIARIYFTTLDAS